MEQVNTNTNRNKDLSLTSLWCYIFNFKEVLCNEKEFNMDKLDQLKRNTNIFEKGKKAICEMIKEL